MKKNRLPDLISELKEELSTLTDLVKDIQETFKDIPQAKRQKRIYEESIALKLHNFYTGCERMFQKIADDINGGLPDSPVWHKRLLITMSLEIENIRPEVVSKETARALEDYLAFRHVVRNIYGFEIYSERLSGLIIKLDGIFLKFKAEVDTFIAFLRSVLK